VVKRMFAGIPVDLVRQAWETRHEFLDLIDRFPQTFCHQDAFCGNLFIDERSENCSLLGIDWSFAGPSAAGSELVPLVVGSMPILGPIPFAETDRLADLALNGYLEGLVEAGWQPREEQIRFVLNAGGFWRYTIGSMIGEYLHIFQDESRYESLEQAWGISMEQLADDLGNMNAWLLSRFEDAKKMGKGWN
jgi:hypothetical protein